MPFRLHPPPLGQFRPQRLFHATAVQRQGSTPNHYETLQIPVNATPAEVKKSFYHLSKLHHPDHNPSDPTAKDRFVRISDAYHVLGIPAKRAAYDREHAHTQSHQASSTQPRGSYHSSSSPAGGRSPSGLSRRRTHFQGPPPSFYRSGGWGAHGAKRREAQAGAEARDTSDSPSYTGSGTTGGGFGPGQAPFGFGDQNDVPHFNRVQHFRTQEEMLRRRARAGEGWSSVGDELPMGLLGNFLWVTAVLAFGMSIPIYFYEMRVARTESAKKK